MKLHISTDGSARAVLSDNGNVIAENAVSLPRNPSRRDLAVALRVLADWLSDFK